MPNAASQVEREEKNDKIIIKTIIILTAENTHFKEKAPLWENKLAGLKELGLSL